MGVRIAILLLAVLCVVVGAPLRTNGDPYVRVNGHDLTIDRKPIHFVGANLAIMHGPRSRAAADEVLQGAAKDGVKVGRVWALGEGEANAPAWQRDAFLFRAGPDGWIEAGPAHLDRVVAIAGRVGVRLIITLSNNWSDYGGVPRYLKWAGQREAEAATYGASDRFYSDPKAKAAFRAHLERLLKRHNTLTGIPYKDDPTILAWELMNESTVSTAAGAEARRAWVVEMAKVAHELDPHHLVMSGVSVYRTESERREWLSVCKLPEVDFCDAHIYPEDLLRNREPALLESAIDDIVQLAHHVAGKPVILGEFGIHGDEQGNWERQSRGYWMGRILERLRFDGASGGVVWLYQPSDGTDKRHGISVGAPEAEGTRAAIREAAAKRIMPFDAVNPDLGPHVGEVPLMSLHTEFIGQASSVPKIVDRPGAAWPRITWDPTTYDRAAWEATGIYDAGAIAHVWGTETGWFEYAYELVAPEAPKSDKGDKPAKAPRTGRVRLPYALTVRARVSSEFPGSLSPPNGASAFEVTLDGISVGTATAPRDDGRGAWIEVRTGKTDVMQAVAVPGKHRLRFTVSPGPKAHGLCIYGQPGEKGGATGRTGPVELKIDR
jgi:mannan endo-1,4-beta-mannosidase